MSQRNVERVIGRLVTDETFRRRYARDPRGTLDELAACGIELTGCERAALLTLDAGQAERFAEAIDPRLQKVDLCGGE